MGDLGAGTATFVEGQTFTWKEPNQVPEESTEWVVKQPQRDGKVTIVNAITGEVRDEERILLVSALFNGTLHFTGATIGNPRTNQVKGSTSVIDLSDYPESSVQVAKYRLYVIQPLLDAASGLADKVFTYQELAERVKQVRGELGLPVPATAEAENGACLGKKGKKGKSSRGPLLQSVSVRSIRQWIKLYRESGYMLTSLMPNVNRSARGSHLREKVRLEAMIDNAIQDTYMVREEVSASKVRNELSLRIEETNARLLPENTLKVPSLSTVARRIQALDRYQVMAVKKGTRAAERLFAQYGRVIYPDVPLAEVEMDNSTMNLIVIDDRDCLPLGRLTLTLSIDLATRYPLGLYIGFDRSSAASALACLLHTISPKGDLMSQFPGLQHQWLAYGVPAKLRVDNGKDFVSQEFRDACDMLGITLEYTPANRPEFKATIERMFGTMNTLFHSLPGTTFSNPLERGDYNSEGTACVLLSTIYQIVHVHLLDIYAESKHRGLDGGIPARRWEQLTSGLFTPRLPYSADDLQVMLGQTEYRVVHPYGVEYLGLRYNHQDLGPLRVALKGKKAKVKINPYDLGTIQVYDPFGTRTGMNAAQSYINVRALNYEDVSGRSVWKHKIIAERALEDEGEVNPASLGRAQRVIQSLVQGGMEAAQSTLASRARHARYEFRRSAGQPV